MFKWLILMIVWLILPFGGKEAPKGYPLVKLLVA